MNKVSFDLWSDERFLECSGALRETTVRPKPAVEILLSKDYEGFGSFVSGLKILGFRKGRAGSSPASSTNLPVITRRYFTLLKQSPGEYQARYGAFGRLAALRVRPQCDHFSSFKNQHTKQNRQQWTLIEITSGGRRVARINFEDRVFKEQGFQDLMIEVRSRHLAKGITLELFQLAQEFWFPDRRPIPMDRFRAAGLPEVLFAAGGLCELVNGDVYVRGSKEAFQWLFDASDAGKKSAEARKNKSGTSQPKKTRQKKSESLERPSNPVERPSKVVEGVSTSYSSLSSLTLSSSLSSQDSLLNLSSQSSLERKPEPSGASAPLAIVPVSPQDVVGTFYSSWKARYKGRAPLLPEDHAKLKRLVDGLGGSVAKELVTAYLKMETSWFTKKRHDVQTLMSNLSQVQHFVSTGEIVTDADARNVEASSSIENQIRRLGEARS